MLSQNLDVCMDFEPYFKVHNLVSVHPKSVILCQMTNLNMVFHMVVSVYRLAKILKLAPVPWWILERLIQSPLFSGLFAKFCGSKSCRRKYCEQKFGGNVAFLWHLAHYFNFNALLHFKIMQNSGRQSGDWMKMLVAKEKKLVALATVLVAISSPALHSEKARRKTE